MIVLSSVSLAVPGASMAADALRGSDTTSWNERGRRYTLTLDVNYTARYLGPAVEVNGYARAYTNLPVQRLCIKHWWTLTYGRGAGSDRPVSEWEGAPRVELDHYREPEPTRRGLDFFFRGFVREKGNATTTSVGFPRRSPLGWTSTTHKAFNSRVTVRAYVASARDGCFGRPWRTLKVKAN